MGGAKLSVIGLLLVGAVTAFAQHPSVVFTDLSLSKRADGRVSVSYGVETESWNRYRAMEPKLRFEIRHDASDDPTIAEVPLRQYGRFDLPVHGSAHLRATLRTRSGGSLGIRIREHAGPMTTFSVHTDWLQARAETPAN